METVTVERRIGADPAAVEAAMEDVEAFTRASGFDEVSVDGDRIEVANRVGIATLELTLELFDAPDAALAYRQVEGVFDEMETRYRPEPAGEGCRVVATTEFALDVALLGDLMDATVVTRRRRSELEAQLSWLADAADAGADAGNVGP